MSSDKIVHILILISGMESFKRSLPQKSGLQCKAPAFQVIDLCAYLLISNKGGPEWAVRPSPRVRSREGFYRNMISSPVIRMGITSQRQFQDSRQEIQQNVPEMSLKDCYENLGYRYNDMLKSTPPLRGVIAMANTGPNSNGSQFFINLVDTPWLAGKHTVFGKVVQGMDVVDKIGAMPVDESSKPQKTVRILSVRLERR